MTWTALVPMKWPGEGKTRLSGCLSQAERACMAESLFMHVLAVLGRSPRVGRIVVLCRRRPFDWAGDWIPDLGRGLNPELEAASSSLGPGPVLIIHADLPLLTTQDVESLIEAAGEGIALAPDRHGAGTNALALGRRASLRLAFGAGSLRKHLAQAAQARVVSRPGFLLDLDTPEDLALYHGPLWREHPAA